MNKDKTMVDAKFEKAETREARHDFANAISIYRDILSQELPTGPKLKALDGLTRSLVGARDFDAAEKAGTEMYEFLKATFGPQHKNVGLGLNRLIRIATEKKEIDKANALSNEAIEVFTKVADEAPEERKAAAKHQLATVYFTLANNYFNSEDYDGAEKASKGALEQWLEVEGPKGQNVATLYNNLGRIFEIRGQREEGIEFHKKSVAIRKEILGAHADTAFSLGNLGTSYAEMGNFFEAIGYLNEAVELYESLGMSDLPICESYRQNMHICMETADEEGKEHKRCSM